jgi:hypothetical protein
VNLAPRSRSSVNLAPRSRFSVSWRQDLVPQFLGAKISLLSEFGAKISLLSDLAPNSLHSLQCANKAVSCSEVNRRQDPAKSIGTKVVRKSTTVVDWRGAETEPRLRPRTVALREVRKHQKSTDPVAQFPGGLALNGPIATAIQTLLLHDWTENALF